MPFFFLADVFHLALSIALVLHFWPYVFSEGAEHWCPDQRSGAGMELAGSVLLESRDVSRGGSFRKQRKS